MSISVDVVTSCWNEAMLLPFFLKHYEYADTIHVLYDEDSTDETLGILSERKNVIIYPIRYPDGIDWEIKSGTINKIALNCKSDWVIAVDADEFIWPIQAMDKTKEYLEQQPGNLIFAGLFTVYRNHSESDLDYSNPSVLQRRHGDPVIGRSYGQAGYVKPCVVKPETGVEWNCGIHSYKPNPNITPNADFMVGAHWCMADPMIAMARRIGQSKRQSKNNMERNHGYQNFRITEKEIRDECERHEHDPQLF